MDLDIALNYAQESSRSQLPPDNQYICKDCGSSNICNESIETVCCDCGIIQSVFPCTTAAPYEYPITSEKEYKSNKINKSCAKIQRMQDWYMWTNDEKNEYKLLTYTKALCATLGIPELMVSEICATVIMVVNTIKKHDGTKRARVKDGIILTCIQYVSKETQHYMSAVDMSKKIKLDIKYVTKADNIILELINRKKLNLDRTIMFSVQSPYYYVQCVIQKHNLKIPEKVLQLVQQLINLCEANDILLDHTPLSVGVCCFYYVLQSLEIPTDFKSLTHWYDLSFVTVLKTFNKLRLYQQFVFEQTGIKPCKSSHL